MKICQKIIIAFLLIVGFILAGVAYAQFPTIDPGPYGGGSTAPSGSSGRWTPLVPCGGEGNPCTLCHLWQMASNIINFAIFYLAIPLAVFLFVVGGVLLMTAAGSPEKIAKAKGVFTKTIIGLVIIFCSWLIVDTLIKTMVNPSTETGQVIWAWNVFPSCD